jgi:hypothetical protein
LDWLAKAVFVLNFGWTGLQKLVLLLARKSCSFDCTGLQKLDLLCRQVLLSFEIKIGDLFSNLK